MCQREPYTAFFQGSPYRSYRELPCITEEEIAAIAALRQSRGYFYYTIMSSSDAFIQADGTVVGFAPLLAGFLSDFFDIPFVLRLDSWENIIEGLEAGTIDFNSDLTPTPERRERFIMSHPVAQRNLAVYSLYETPEFYSRLQLIGRRVGFLYGAITYPFVMNAYPYLHMERVDINSLEEVPQALEDGYIDAFVFINHSLLSVDLEDAIRSQYLFTEIFIPVSLNAANPELQPVISIFNRYVESGGIHNLYALFRRGFVYSARYILNNSFTVQERAFLGGIAASGAAIPVGLEPNNYPVSFFNSREGEFQGIVPDILAMVTELTGLQFEAAAGRDSSRDDILNMLRAGDVALISELNSYEIDEFQNDFLWGTRGEQPFFTDHFILMSRVDVPNFQLHHVIHVNVGVVAGSVYESKLGAWFPDALHVRRFGSNAQALAALEAGEVDLFMTRANTLLSKINFNETAGFKANLTFGDQQIESFIGFNANYYILQSVFSRTMPFIDVEGISKDWTNRFFDHARAATQQAFRNALIFAGILSLTLVALMILFVRKRKAVALYKEKAAILNAIYMTLPDAVHCKDVNGRYTSCNYSFEKFADRAASDVIGKTPFEVYADGSHDPQIYTASDRRVLSEKVIIREEAWHKSGGAELFFETLKAPLLVEGETIGLLSIGRDMTAHKKAMDALEEAIEAVKQADKKKGEFLARMSHEIRTPMNAISGMAELSLNSDRPELIREYVGTIKHASASLLAIVNDILDFSKIEAGKVEIVSKEYSLASLINDVINITKVKAADSRLRFMVNIDSRLPDALVGDDIRMRQVLLNLLSNAFKYTERGFVSFFVEGESSGDNEVALSFRVEDTGIGIKQENMEDLFNEYAQFDLDKNRGIEGTGLGLPIVKGLLNKMGGEINVASEYGKGSVFTVTLPQKVAAGKPLVSLENPKGKKTIVFEPREIYRRFMSSAFDNLGVPAVFVSSEADLHEKTQEGDYPFVFISMWKYKKHKAVLGDIKKKSKIVVFSEFGQEMPDTNTDVSILGMPFHSIVIASVLDSASHSAISYNEAAKFVARFTAPDANILVVDDIVTNLKVAKGLLLPYKANVDICKSGATAVEAVKANRYDLIFMDHKMPGLDGIEATNRIRALAAADAAASAGAADSYFQDVPIIALTANAIAGAKEMFLENGLNDFLSKPIDTVKLGQILEQWLPKEKRVKN